jgi:hypothetical protein
MLYSKPKFKFYHPIVQFIQAIFQPSSTKSTQQEAQAQVKGEINTTTHLEQSTSSQQHESETNQQNKQGSGIDRSVQYHVLITRKRS